MLAPLLAYSRVESREHSLTIDRGAAIGHCEQLSFQPALQGGTSGEGDFKYYGIRFYPLVVNSVLEGRFVPKNENGV